MTTERELGSVIPSLTQVRSFGRCDATFESSKIHLTSRSNRRRVTLLARLLPYCPAMCQRYSLPDQATVEREFMPARAWWSFTPKYNVAAHQYVPVIRWHDGQSEAVMMRWGLVPSSAEGRAGDSPLTIDAEAIMASPIYRNPWLEGQRCIMPCPDSMPGN